MNARAASILLWSLALAITLASAYYQRRTGPSYAVAGRIAVGGETVSYSLPRTHGGDGDAPISIVVTDVETHGALTYRRFKSHDEWATIAMSREGDRLIASLPHQPPAGKVTYTVTLTPANGEPVPLTRDPVIIRFKGGVPLTILVPHVVLMFLAMLLSTRAGLEALTHGPRVAGMTWWTLGLLLLGGLFLGPVVQKYAFGSFWTGWPFGQDMTDNKTLVAFLGWAYAAYRVRRRRPRSPEVIIAAVLLLAVYLIPHSVLGSELDYTRAPAGQNVGP